MAQLKDTIILGDLSVTGNIYGNNKIFWATYGTPFSEIKKAVDSGAPLIGVKYLGTAGFMNNYNPGSNNATFISYGIVPTPPGVVILEMSVTNSTWSVTTYTLAQSNVSGVVQPDKGGTGQTSLQATRNAMGLGNTTGALPVANGGTGATTLTSGAALIGAGTGAVTTRTIRNNTATSGVITADTALITSNTLRYAINRTTSVAAADTGYTTYMARGQALNSADTNPTVNGAISWTYS